MSLSIPRRLHLPTPGALALAWVVLVLLATGAGRVLVVCRGPHDSPRLEVVHSAHGCVAECMKAPHCGATGCDEAPGTGATLEDDDDCGGCVDQSLELDPGTRPKGSHWAGPEPAPASSACAPLVPEEPRTTAARRRSVDRPPDPDPRIGLVRSVVLLI